MKSKREKDLETALYKIAGLGFGIKEEIRDWGNIGRNAVMIARDSLSGKCKLCGSLKTFKPRETK